MSVLDNIVWHAALGEQAHLADRVGRAATFHPDVAPFAAVEDLADRDAWRDLAQIVGESGIALLFAPDVSAPPGWSKDVAIPCLQMVATDVETSDVDGVVELGPSDLDEMTALIKETNPGPFRPRTTELGRYVGIREEGRLVAVAGERFKVPGFTEISMVCTDPNVRRRGLAERVVVAMIANIRSRGEEAMLHVISENMPAIKLYEKMGFEKRTGAEAAAVRLSSAKLGTSN